MLYHTVLVSALERNILLRVLVSSMPFINLNLYVIQRSFFAKFWMCVSHFMWESMYTPTWITAASLSMDSSFPASVVIINLSKVGVLYWSYKKETYLVFVKLRVNSISSNWFFNFVTPFSTFPLRFCQLSAVSSAKDICHFPFMFLRTNVSLYYNKQ